MMTNPNADQPEFKAARRGDAVLIPCEASYTSLGINRRTVFRFAVVTSVTRDGKVKAAERPFALPGPWKFGAPARSWVVPKSARVPDPVALVRACPDEYPTFETAQRAARAWLDAQHSQTKAKRAEAAA